MKLSGKLTGFSGGRESPVLCYMPLNSLDTVKILAKLALAAPNTLKNEAY